MRVESMCRLLSAGVVANSRELLALSIVMAAAAAAKRHSLYTFEYYTDVCVCIPFTLLFLFIFFQTWPPTRPPCCTLAPECYLIEEGGVWEKEKEQRTGTAGTRTRFRLLDRVSCHRELLVDAPIICRAYTSSGFCFFFFEFGELISVNYNHLLSFPIHFGLADRKMTIG